MKPSYNFTKLHEINYINHITIFQQILEIIKYKKQELFFMDEESDVHVNNETLQESEEIADASAGNEAREEEFSGQPIKFSEWMKKFGWKKNPFIFEIRPDLIVGYDEERQQLLDYVSQGHRAVLLTGPTGAGKTTILKWLEKSLKNRKVFFISKPPETQDELVEFFSYELRKPWPLSLFSRKIRNVYDVISSLNKMKKGKVLIVDECHESSREFLEWLRVMTDQVDSITIVVAGLPKTEQMLRQAVETFYQRISMNIALKTLTFEQVRDLIKKRIEDAGGSGMGPFNDSIVQSIYERTSGFPREVLRMADMLVNSAASRGTYKLSVEQADEKEQYLPELTAMQMEIIGILMESEMSPSDIASRLDLSKYKSKQHAVRSVNNILSQLMGMNLLERRKMGKAYIYSLKPGVRAVLVER